MRQHQLLTAAGALALALALAAQAQAGSHLWRIHEVFSNDDGTIQFIELHECCGEANERFLVGKWVRSQATGMQFDFPENLPPDSTANKYLLLATAAFAAQPGAPTPDYIIPEHFVGIDGDTLAYWNYNAAEWTYAGGNLPTDGVHSLVCLANNSSGCSATAIEVNSPMNFDDETGSVVVPCDPADLDLSGGVDIGDLLGLLAAWGPCLVCDGDLTGNNVVDIQDLLELLAAWGPC